MSYTVKLQPVDGSLEFEGPLDLLLQLIEDQKMDITQVSLAKITDQYLTHLKTIENIDPASLADFLVVAARLILIKSRAILPVLEITGEEEESIEDLQRRLEEYRKFRQAGLVLGKIFRENRAAYSREAFQGIGVTFYPPRNVQVVDLKTAFQKILSQLPIIEKLPQGAIKEVVSLKEKINLLQLRLKEKSAQVFQRLIKDEQSKLDIIVSFLAVLELAKQQLIKVRQKGPFEEIILEEIKNGAKKTKIYH
ncbi:MAG TPA: hypothetical protein ENI16_01095 [Candidatus Portnoybacteria bacterium]|nr:hypothetical protein [Candidatus Portnoybacteria bacterium]